MGDDYWRSTQAYQAGAAWWQKAGPTQPDGTGANWLREITLLAENGVFSARIVEALAEYFGKGRPANPGRGAAQLGSVLESMDRNKLASPEADALADALKVIEYATVFQNQPAALKAVLPGLRHLASLDHPVAHYHLAYLSACSVEPRDPAQARHSFAALSTWGNSTGNTDIAARARAALRDLNEQKPELCARLKDSRIEAARRRSAPSPTATARS